MINRPAREATNEYAPYSLIGYMPFDDYCIIHGKCYFFLLKLTSLFCGCICVVSSEQTSDQWVENH